ncbi:OmpA family protein [Brumimicrobium mesophilum]|uniref:OmpA family protein n=1 Tax=Brumimicrobium mesophilum TaxID=392717 RepID=UPI000D144679|nr:OmpA family protein [Brumimicrobium mesophilum]
MKITILSVLSVFSTLICFGQSELVYFDTDEHSLTNETKLKLDAIIQVTKNNSKINEIGIIGHTDADASFEYNKELSLKRAKSVKNYLISKGLNNRFHVFSKSESEVLNEGLTEIEKANNRRVEIILDYDTNNSIYETLDKDFQVYKISSQKDTLITCLEGTVLDIGKDVFALKNKSSDLIIKVKEYYNKSDFISANLTTLTNNNELLESRGMINIEAYQDGEEIQLKEDKSLGIFFKDREVDDGTGIFIGSEDNNEVIWNQSWSGFTDISSYGWSVTYYEGGDTIKKSQWWYEKIDTVTYKIRHTIQKGVEKYDTLNAESEMLMKDLMLSSSSLGWINCDRFYKSDGPKTDFVVEINEDFSPDISIVFSEINSVLPYSYREDNKFIFNNVPQGMKISIVGLYKSTQDDQIYFASEKSLTKSKSHDNLVFKLVEEADLKEKFKSL